MASEIMLMPFQIMPMKQQDSDGDGIGDNAMEMGTK